MVQETVQKDDYMIQNYVVKVGDCYRYRRWVPAYVAHLDKRKEIKISLKTRDPHVAGVRANIYNDQIENFWKALVHAGNSNNLMEKYKAAVQLAQSHGFAYKTSEQVAAMALNEITERLSASINASPLGENQQTTEAILGGVEKPKIKLSECCDLFWDLVHDRHINKSKRQIDKWKNPRKLAMKNFIQVVGDKFLHETTRGDILKFRGWCNERIKNGWTPNSANKQLIHTKDVMKTISLNYEIDLKISSMFVETSFKNVENSRPPFEASFVQNQILPALGKLEEIDRFACMAIADTGARQREIFGLLPEDIKLDEDIPYIWIRPRKNYTLKTPTSERRIPLVGTALYAFQKFPDGFNHLGNHESFSASANEFLTDNNLRPTPEHAANSLRHTFKDRLRDYGDVGAPEEIIDELMGHRKPGVHYGRGHKLETKHRILSKIAFDISKFNC